MATQESLKNVRGETAGPPQEMFVLFVCLPTAAAEVPGTLLSGSTYSSFFLQHFLGIAIMRHIQAILIHS